MIDMSPTKRIAPRKFSSISPPCTLSADDHINLVRISVEVATDMKRLWKIHSLDRNGQIRAQGTNNGRIEMEFIAGLGGNVRWTLYREISEGCR